ncbi:hypothetical protein OV203_09110 [Nannocystis sp. ILAH1]|uniref:hypothetical protein n=1 Tax=Nannocystis sp. ILAH1 TaxID=2996789 RepID=UPI00227201EB|nr:hypothetical protein [Nannocystis sp. ILAH1]MCY0987280.1 hypothetical protein [Nannocystis sp. ILAH1]
MLRALVVVVLAAVAAAPACKGSESALPAGEVGGGEPTRVPLVPKDHALYARFEGTSLDNGCSDDSACNKGGCSNEVCAAGDSAPGTCDVPEVQIPSAANCGCVSGECVWYADGNLTLAAAAEKPAAAEQPGPRCGDVTCAAGETCIEYYGIAGPRGPKFETCGIPCPNGKCADGKKCITISDGPGPVCQ